ncbi:MAG: hypothetical protein DCC50_00435 [Acidobacteria bacterium]|nr:MAG: hypothetical protein DCC50_00435 [Acidobacteriota bacterium]
METLGGPGASLAIAAENLFPPIPSEIILPLAGFTASQGTFTLAGAIFWTTLGSVVGALALYLVGRAFGRERFRAVWSRLPLVNLDDLDRTEAWFARHGAKTVFFGRMVPIFRSLISIPAGLEAMPAWLFLSLTTAGSLVWNSIFVVAGYQLGENWFRVEPYADTFQKIVIAVVVLVVGVWAVRRALSNRRAART